MSMVFPNKGKPWPVKATTTLTASYVAATIPVSVDEHNMIGFQVTYTKGNETSVEMKVESSIDGGATYAQQVTQTASGGTVTLVPAVYSITAASCASVQIFSFIVTPLKADVIRISVSSTGGTPTGTYSITAINGWV